MLHDFSKKLPKNLNDVINTDDILFKSFLNKSIENGIYFAPSKFEAGFISTKHTNKEISKLFETQKKTLSEKWKKKKWKE